jgi:hypothetical protein
MTPSKAADRSSCSDFWRLDGSHALLRSSTLRGEIDLLHPARGLSGVCVDGAAHVGWLMGVDVASAETRGEPKDQPWDITDAYIRGRDLVAHYREPLEQPFNLQVYWRVVESLDGAPALDLICSVQTPLWEAHPVVTVCSSMFECSPAIAEGALVTAGPRDRAYLEVTRHGDFQPMAPGEDAQFIGPFWRFGPQFMEKGVIRRLQLRGAFVPADEASSRLRELQNELAAERPALTT